MKRLAVVMRHGECDKQKYNDGPLTKEGERCVRYSTQRLKNVLRMHFQPGTRQVTVSIAMLVSGSLRGLDTYRIMREELDRDDWLMSNGFVLVRQEISTKFFSTPDEDVKWHALRADETFKAATAMLGGDEALLTNAHELIHGPACRVVAVTRDGTEPLTIVITHSPHDRLIVEGLTGTRPTDTLELGCFRIVEFEQ